MLLNQSEAPSVPLEETEALIVWGNEQPPLERELLGTGANCTLFWAPELIVDNG